MVERMEAQELERRYDGAMQELNEVEQVLGKALEYPRYCDDLKNFPDATEADGVCVGEHTPGTLAQEMASKYELLTKQNTSFLVQAMQKGTELSEIYKIFKMQTDLVAALHELLKSASHDLSKAAQKRNTMEMVNKTLLKHINKLHGVKQNSDVIYELAPNWEDCPEWCMYWTVDADGDLRYWRNEPHIEKWSGMWYDDELTTGNSEEMTWIPKPANVELPVGIDWRVMFFKRPLPIEEVKI